MFLIIHYICDVLIDQYKSGETLWFSIMIIEFVGIVDAESVIMGIPENPHKNYLLEGP